MPRRARGELMKKKRFVEFLEMIVQNVVVLFAAELLGFRTQHQRVRRLRALGRLRQEVQGGAGLLHAAAGVGKLARVIAHRIADDPAHVPAGEGVVADVGDAAGCQLPRADVEQLFLHVGRHPRIDAVRDDVVEYAGFFAEIAQVDLLELDVGETQRRDVGSALHAPGRRKSRCRGSGSAARQPPSESGSLRRRNRFRARGIRRPARAPAGAAELSSQAGPDATAEKPGSGTGIRRSLPATRRSSRRPV